MENTMGQRISTLRKRKGYTQEQVAQKVGVTAQAVSKWESDKACPDVGIIPELAKMLGVSADVILGTAPLPDEDETVYEGVVEDEKKKKSKTNVSWEWKWDAKAAGLIFPVSIIIFGVCLFINVYFKLNVSVWNIVWTDAVLCLGIWMMIHRLSPFSVGVTFTGLYFLLHNFGVITINATWSLVLPVLLVLWGLTMIIDRLIPRKKKKNYGHQYFRYTGSDKEKKKDFSCTDGDINCEIRFSEDYISVNTPILRGGNAEISFGECTLDLSGCESVVQDALLKADVSFGELKLIVPPHIRIIPESSKSFGSVNVLGAPREDAQYTLTLDCDVSFGELNIKYN
ncbi:MAG: helix-turn-helix domain-containing protein [Clostridia bacterium]|nr:helix-turn-helix domain-containing protein [Clostridia bacterium]